MVGVDDSRLAAFTARGLMAQVGWLGLSVSECLMLFEMPYTTQVNSRNGCTILTYCIYLQSAPASFCCYTYVHHITVALYMFGCII